MSNGAWWVVATATLAVIGADLAAAGAYGAGVLFIVAAIACGVAGIARLAVSP